MKRLYFFIIITFSVSNLSAQIEDAWVYFKDKPSEASYFSSPLKMLTQRSLDRRARFSIHLDSKDVPIDASYVLKIKESGVSILARSKWLNALHVQDTKVNIDALLSIEFNGNTIVSSIEYANKSLNSSKTPKSKNKISKKRNKLEFKKVDIYGDAENQLSMLKGDSLHLKELKGLGIQIAVLDAGFPNVNSLLAFKQVIDNNQILGGYDFVNRSLNYFTGNYHGMSVLSTMAGYLENGINGATNNYIGTAPGAEYYLFITEDSNKEVKLEESLWVEAAERADSLGVDIINTSLGYSVFFDNTNHNYSYSDMDGQTAFITRGAEIAFSRGMILVNSAGNEGGDPDWPYINAPADGPSVLTIGAVKSNEEIASFSSFGPTYDGRIKPDVCAQGQGTALINTSGNVVFANGTSFSSPVLAGVIACLWQAFPNKTNDEIVQLVRESGHLYDVSTKTNATIDYQMGYGIPNFSSIFNALEIEKIQKGTAEVVFYPNPASNNVYIKFPKGISNLEITLFSTSGSKIIEEQLHSENPKLDISYLSTGLYLLKINYGNEIKEFKILKN
ncbi:S8 family serine peptidase [Lutibacter citreus]|uniref:S8 family serine peptidase n=1 Tax=Lutibacter citreus TaxID=2138210 RepID=UPI0015D024F5|nr:S8 family serine peptidase [Lutibacter citreus]